MDKSKLNILIGCEQFGRVRDSFLELGFDGARSCDIEPDQSGSNYHIVDDVRNVLASGKWDLLIVAHPPCTRLCNSGVRWLKVPPPNRTLEDIHAELEDGCELFADLYNADTLYGVKHIAIENPVMHKYAKAGINEATQRITDGRQSFPNKATQSVQPYEFAESIDAEDNFTKRTCFWLKGLPLLQKTGSLTKETARDDIHKAPPSEDRGILRSKFPIGMAKAIAQQWGGAIA